MIIQIIVILNEALRGERECHINELYEAGFITYLLMLQRERHVCINSALAGPSGFLYTHTHAHAYTCSQNYIFVLCLVWADLTDLNHPLLERHIQSYEVPSTSVTPNPF